MIKDLMVVAFAMAAGFALSGIAANLYRLFVPKPAVSMAQTSNLLVMIVAGPNVLMDNFTSALRARKCSKPVFWIASAVAGYWSFVLGLFLLNVAITFHS